MSTNHNGVYKTAEGEWTIQYYLDFLRCCYDNKGYLTDDKTKVTKFVLQGENIKKIPDLSSISNTLKELHIKYTSVTKIENLEKFKNLSYLNLSNNNIKKIEGLKSLICLEVLNLSNNKIKKIENLNEFINIEELYLNNNEISVFEGIDKLINLEKLDLNNNILDINKKDYLSIIQSNRKTNLNLNIVKNNKVIKNIFGF